MVEQPIRNRQVASSTLALGSILSDSESIADACDTLTLFIFKFCVIEMFECLRIACMSLSSTPSVCGLVPMPRRKACQPCHKGRELSRSKTWPSGLCSSSCFLQITHGESSGMITRRQLLLQENEANAMVQAKPIRILTVVRVHLRHLPLY